MTGFSGMAGGGKITPTLREADTLLKGILGTLREIDRLSSKISNTSITGGSGTGSRVAGQGGNRTGRASSSNGMPTPSIPVAAAAPTASNGTEATSSTPAAAAAGNRFGTVGAKFSAAGLGVVGLGVAGAIASTYERVGKDVSSNVLSNNIARTGTASWSAAGQRRIDAGLVKASFGGYLDEQDRQTGLNTQRLTGQDLGSQRGMGYNSSIASLAKFSNQSNAAASTMAAKFADPENINRAAMLGIKARDSQGNMASPQAMMDAIYKTSVGGRKVSADDIRKGLLPGAGINVSLSNMGMDQAEINDFAKPYMMAKADPSLKDAKTARGFSSILNKAGDVGNKDAALRESSLTGIELVNKAAGGLAGLFEDLATKIPLLSTAIQSASTAGGGMATMAGSATGGAAVAAGSLLAQRAIYKQGAGAAARGAAGRVGTGLVAGAVGLGAAGAAAVGAGVVAGYAGLKGVLGADTSKGRFSKRAWQTAWESGAGGWFGYDAPEKGMALGGIVPGDHSNDTVPIRATPGEVVVPRHTVGRHGGAGALMRKLGFGGGDGEGGLYAKGGEVTGDTKGLNADFLQRLQKWSAYVGKPYNVGSGYRSMEEQQVLYDRWMRKVPGQAQAAKPGSSNHNFGLASDGPHWRNKNPEKFGLRYPMSFEPWHVEPVGARDMRGSVGTSSSPAAGSASPALTSGDWKKYANQNGTTEGVGYVVKSNGGEVDAIGGEKAQARSGSISGNRAIGQRLASAYKWGGGDQWTSLDALFTKESNWNHKAQNPTSTAFGIAQFLNSTWAGVGAKKTSDPEGQISAGLKYIKGRYGDPEKAWDFHKKNNYYSEGAWQTKTETANLHQGEMVIPARIAESVRSELSKGTSRGGGGPVNINVYPAKADMQEAKALARMVKDILEDDKSMTAIGSF